MVKKIIIAIDGFSSCGKSTMAKDLAKKLGYTYIDSGAMYRATTLFAIRHGYITSEGINDTALQESLPDIHIDFRYNSSTGKVETLLNDESVEDEIRGMEVSSQVSKISAKKYVREAMVSIQKALGSRKGIVMDGRDIGTVVFPDAEMKVFVTARPEVRAERRLRELQSKQHDHVTFEQVLQNIKQRDYDDQNRQESPLKQAADAWVLDNSDIDIQQQQQQLINRFHQIIEQ